MIIRNYDGVNTDWTGMALWHDKRTMRVTGKVPLSNTMWHCFDVNNRTYETTVHHDVLTQAYIDQLSYAHRELVNAVHDLYLETL